MTATITKSREMEATLSPSARARNTVVPNGVDRSLFRVVPRDDARRELGWPISHRIVLFAPHPAVPRKRYWLAEAACRQAEQSVGAINLIFGGDISPEAMPLYMAAADCLLLTSSSEGSPNVVKEAMACDLPVVSTAVGDVRQLLREVHPSWICAPDPSELAAGIVECLTWGRRSNGREQSEWLDQERIAVRLVELIGGWSPSWIRSCPPRRWVALLSRTLLLGRRFKSRRLRSLIDELTMPKFKHK